MGKATPSSTEKIPWLQIKVDNGLESSGIRTQFLKRMVNWVDPIGILIQLVYYPPFILAYHLRYPAPQHHYLKSFAGGFFFAVYVSAIHIWGNSKVRRAQKKVRRAKIMIARSIYNTFG